MIDKQAILQPPAVLSEAALRYSRQAAPYTRADVARFIHTEALSSFQGNYEFCVTDDSQTRLLHSMKEARVVCEFIDKLCRSLRESPQVNEPIKGLQAFKVLADEINEYCKANLDALFPKAHKDQMLGFFPRKHPKPQEDSGKYRWLLTSFNTFIQDCFIHDNHAAPGTDSEHEKQTFTIQAPILIDLLKFPMSQSQNPASSKELTAYRLLKLIGQNSNDFLGYEFKALNEILNDKQTKASDRARHIIELIEIIRPEFKNLLLDRYIKLDLAGKPCLVPPGNFYYNRDLNLDESNTERIPKFQQAVDIYSSLGTCEAFRSVSDFDKPETRGHYYVMDEDSVPREAFKQNSPDTQAYADDDYLRLHCRGIIYNQRWVPNEAPILLSPKP